MLQENYQKLSTKNLSDNELAENLFFLAKRKKLVERTVKKFSNNKHYSSIFNQECVESELLYTILKTINAVKNNLGKDAALKIKSKKSMNLSTLGMAEGYMITAFRTNIRKTYDTQKNTQKRQFNGMVYLDSYIDNDDWSTNKMESIIAKDHFDDVEYKDLVNTIFKSLREEDKLINRERGLKGKKASNLAKLFILLANDKRYGANLQEISKRMNWSMFLTKKNHKELKQKVNQILNKKKGAEAPLLFLSN
tara:strand:+ start:2105 stop:2857 length:753 start_codon:yes stop_codon:yes gene_type:complete